MMSFKKAILRNIIYLVISTLFAVAFIDAKSISLQTDPFAILKGYKRVKSLKGKTGELLGYIYIKESSKYTNDVLSALLVVKQKGARLDTLYRIDSNGFFNLHGKVELKHPAKNYYGFKLKNEKKTDTDFFTVGYVDSKGKLDSDDNNYFIDWNYKNKLFEYSPMP
jgi:hypothetical protein